MKKNILLVLLFSSALITNAYAIKNGGPDNGEHPYVGLAVYDDEFGNPMWRCSGALISPTVYLTAGHCTYGASKATIWFEEDVQAGMPDNGYPHGSSTTVDGMPHTHPDYNPAIFVLYDLGVVILDEPVYMESYGELPEVGLLDAFHDMRGLQDTTMTAVGYGLQKINPVHVTEQRVRLKAVLNLVSINGNSGIPAGGSISLSNNADTGGTCFGDSGGPLFKTDTHIVAAVTSYAMNGNCAGISGGYRVDTDDDLNWLYTEFGVYME